MVTIIRARLFARRHRRLIACIERDGVFARIFDTGDAGIVGFASAIFAPRGANLLGLRARIGIAHEQCRRVFARVFCTRFNRCRTACVSAATELTRRFGIFSCFCIAGEQSRIGNARISCAFRWGDDGCLEAFAFVASIGTFFESRFARRGIATI